MAAPHNYRASIADAETKLSDLRGKFRSAKDPSVRATLYRAIQSSLLLLEGLALLERMTTPRDGADLQS